MTQQTNSNRTHIADSLGLREKFQHKYSRQGYLHRYTTTYLIQQVLTFAFMIFLGLCSFKFWELLFSGKLNEQVSFWAALTATSVWIIVTTHLIGKNIEAHYAKDTVSWILLVVCVLLVAGDITFNLKGIPELTAAMMEKPTDAKSPTLSARYDGQLATINNQIKQVKVPFYWCPTHKTNHHKVDGEALIIESCKDLRFYIDGRSSKYVTARNKLAALERQLQEVQSSYNAESTAAGKVYADELREYQDKKKLRSESLKWIQGGIYLLLILLTFWKHQYGSKSAEAMQASSYPPPSDPGTGGNDDYLYNMMDEVLERMEKMEKGNNSPGPAAKASNPPQDARIVSMHPHYTDGGTAAVAASTAAVPQAEQPVIQVIRQEGEGFPIICAHCGQRDVLLQKPRPGQYTFCKTKSPGDPDYCRKAFWAEQRKSRRKASRVGK